MKDERKTKKQLIEELEASRGEVTDLREKVAGVDVSAVERQLASQRIRAEVASMRSSDDLHRVAGVMYEQMMRLGVETPSTNISFVEEEGNRVRNYGAVKNPRQYGLTWSRGTLRDSNDAIAVGSEVVDVETHTQYASSVRAWRERRVLVFENDVEDLKYWREVHHLEGDGKAFLELWKGHWHVTNVPFDHGFIGFRERKHSDKYVEIVRELAEALSLGYLRFLDFQKVEEQNRELQVEAALERVRARALGMQDSDDIGGVTTQLFREFNALGIPVRRSGIWILDVEPGKGEIWLTEPSGATRRGEPFDTSAMDEHPDTARLYRAFRHGEPYVYSESSLSEAVDLALFFADRLHVLNEYAGEDSAAIADGWSAFYPDGRVHAYEVMFPHGMITLVRADALSEEELEIARRFTDVFAIAYTRHAELQAKEKQNRALQVEAALERVRSMALAMQTPQDLPAVSAAVFREIQALDVKAINTAIGVIDEDRDQISQWTILPEDFPEGAGDFAKAKVYDGDFRVAEELFALSKLRQVHPFYKEVLSSFTQDGPPVHMSKHWTKTESLEEIDRLVELGLWTPDQAEEVRDWWAGDTDMSVFRRRHSYLWLILHEPLSPGEVAELKRFTEVFSFAYDRFRELQEKERQNRELIVEQALERVRTAIAEMESSEGIEGLVDVVGQELRDLGVVFDMVGINTVASDSQAIVFRTKQSEQLGSGGLAQETATKEFIDVSPIFSTWRQHWTERRTWHRETTVADWEVEFPHWARVLDEDTIRREREEFRDLRVLDTYFDHGSMVVSRSKLDPFSDDDIALLERFTEVFALGYRRYLDLQAAEERARQADLDRASEHIRAEAMAMETTADIRRVVGVVRGELLDLGFSDRFPIVINYVDEKDDDHTYAYFALPNPRQRGLTWETPDLWEVDERTAAALVVWNESEAPRTFIADQEIVRLQGDIDADKFEAILHRVGLDPEIFDYADMGTHITCIPFTHGQIAVRADDFLTDEQIEVVRTLGDGLSLGFTRFQDFQRLEQASLNKSQFLRRMSHDLRSPMNAIIGYSRVVLRRSRDVLDERQVRNLENIETSSGHLLNLINHILDLSRIEAGRSEVNVQQVDVRQLADECADALESIVQEGVELRRELEDVGEISSDPDRLRQVVMNLLGNATKFTAEGSITLSLRRVEDAVELSIADTGVGIPPQDLPHIFDEFRQVERQGGEQTEGTGLGLAIARKTVELLGGTVSAESDVGRGTTFTVRIGDYVERVSGTAELGM